MSWKRKAWRPEGWAKYADVGTARYLPSYPYLQSGPLHTYAGLLCFYLAQNPQNSTQQLTQRVTRARSSPISQPHDSELEDVTLGTQGASQNTSLLRQARSWFGKALSIDPTDEVAQEFIRLVRNHDLALAQLMTLL